MTKETETTYHIATAHTTHDLETSVQRYIDDGWTLIGGPFVIPGDPYSRPRSHGHHIILPVIGQAMIKEFEA